MTVGRCLPAVRQLRCREEKNKAFPGEIPGEALSFLAELLKYFCKQLCPLSVTQEENILYLYGYLASSSRGNDQIGEEEGEHAGRETSLQACPE